jgi:hypothetical protein
LSDIHLSPYTAAIGANAFSYCGELTIDGPETIPSIDPSAFFYCWGIPENYKSAEYNTWYLNWLDELKNNSTEKIDDLKNNEIERIKEARWK